MSSFVEAQAMVNVWWCLVCRETLSVGTARPAGCPDCTVTEPDGKVRMADDIGSYLAPIVNEPEPPPSDAMAALDRMATSTDVRARCVAVISRWLVAQLPGGGLGLSRNRTADKAMAQAKDLIRTMNDADLWTVLAPDFTAFIESIKEAARAKDRAETEHEVSSGDPGQREVPGL